MRAPGLGWSLFYFRLAITAATGAVLAAPMEAQTRLFPLETIRDRCIEFADLKPGTAPADYRDCRVSEFDDLGNVDAQTYYYAIHCIIPDWSGDNGRCGDDSFSAHYHRSRGLAIFVSAGPAAAQLLYERVGPDIGTNVYLAPRLVMNAAGTLLELPIATDGTGRGNVSEYYLREAGGWTRIESEYWLEDLQQRLPPGLAIWKGVWPDLRSMRAEAALYRSGDRNCCRTGGIARIHLAIRAKQIVIDSVRWQEFVEGLLCAAAV